MAKKTKKATKTKKKLTQKVKNPARRGKLTKADGKRAVATATVEPRIVTKIRKIAANLAVAEIYAGKINVRRDKIVASIERLADNVANTIDADAKAVTKATEKAKRDEVRDKRRAELDAKRDIRDAAKQGRHKAKVAKKLEKLTAMRLAVAKLENELND